MTMATSLVKKWKYRLIKGYKQMSGASDVMPSDTGSESGKGETCEEVISSCCSAPASPTPLRPEKAPMPRTRPHKLSNCCCEHQPLVREFKIEEFDYDVAVQENDNNEVAQSGENCKQGEEFSFTLYDVDGYEKITKEDIAGLVTCIYTTLQARRSSSKGTKNIRVRLVVAPNSKSDSEECASSPQNHKLFQSKNVNNLSSVPAMEKLTKESLRKSSPLKQCNEEWCKDKRDYYNQAMLHCRSRILNNNNNSCSFKEDTMRNNNKTGPLIVNNTPHITKNKISHHESFSRDRLTKYGVGVHNSLSSSAPNSPFRAATSTPNAKCKGFSHRHCAPNKLKRRETFNEYSTRNASEFISLDTMNKEYKEIIANNVKKNLTALHGSPRRKREEETAKRHLDILQCKKWIAEAETTHFHTEKRAAHEDHQNLHVLKHKNRQRDSARSYKQVIEWLNNGLWAYNTNDEDATAQVGSSATCGGRKMSSAVDDEDSPLLADCLFVDDDAGVDVGSAATSRRTRRHVHEHVHHHYHHYTQSDSKKSTVSDL